MCSAVWSLFPKKVFLRSSEQDPSETTGPYVCYSMERQAADGVAGKALFYVHDAIGNEKLALAVHISFLYQHLLHNLYV